MSVFSVSIRFSDGQKLTKTEKIGKNFVTLFHPFLSVSIRFSDGQKRTKTDKNWQKRSKTEKILSSFFICFLLFYPFFRRKKRTKTDENGLENMYKLKLRHKSVFVRFFPFILGFLSNWLGAVNRIFILWLNISTILIFGLFK